MADRLITGLQPDNVTATTTQAIFNSFMVNLHHPA